VSLLSTENLVVEAENNRTGRSTTLLDNISVDIREKEITCLIGASGSGKSIFAKTICGLLPDRVFIRRGTVRFRGQPLDYGRIKTLRGKHIFYIPQDAAASLNPLQKIKRQVAEAAEKNIEYSRLLEVFEELNFKEPLEVLESYPFRLSGGENRRCLLAMAVVRKPELLILDEPTSSLDRGSQESFIRLVELIRQVHGLTILWITHDLTLAGERSDSIWVISKGAITNRGNPPALCLRQPTPGTL
jgi:microcin C transport system ATP-binding protein